MKNTDPKAQGLITVMRDHNRDRVPYSNGMIDMDDFSVFIVRTNVSSRRGTTRRNTNKAIAEIIISYKGDYNKMYAENVMGIRSGTDRSIEIAEKVIKSQRVQDALNVKGSDKKRIKAVSAALENQRKVFGQTVHEANLELGEVKNKTQWVPSDLNNTLGHEGGTSEKIREESEANKQMTCSGPKV